MPEYFNYYDDWKSAVLECQRCGWKGCFDDGTVETYDDLMDCHCPKCAWPDAPMLAIVSYPTIKESEENWSKLSESERQRITDRKEFLQRWKANRLVSPDQLPEIEGSDLIISWDFVVTETDDMTVLRHGTTEIWREIALYECYDRFREIVDILRQKYGVRLADVVPTPSSGTYLYGERATSIDIVQTTRRLLKEAHNPCGEIDD